jgi:hypothetical protein
VVIRVVAFSVAGNTLRWTRATIIDAMRRWVAAGKPMSFGALQRAKQYALASAIVRAISALRRTASSRTLSDLRALGSIARSDSCG